MHRVHSGRFPPEARRGVSHQPGAPYSNETIKSSKALACVLQQYPVWYNVDSVQQTIQMSEDVKQDQGGWDEECYVWPWSQIMKDQIQMKTTL